MRRGVLRLSMLVVTSLTLGVGAAQASSWVQETVPNPSSNGNDLLGVSCPLASSCEAVGNYAAGWNGTSWKLQPENTAFAAVSCPLANACTAVGGNGAARWNGTSWTAETLPSQPSAFLAGVSCPTVSYCVAVGASNLNTRSVAMTWRNGIWSVQPTPAAGKYYVLNGVSCTATNACTAVGSYVSSTSSATLPLVERWNGAAWAIQPTPTPHGNPTFASLSGISCTGVNRCMAVGSNNGTFGPLVELWNGSSWSITPAPTPPNTPASLTSVSCIGSGVCLAVGSGVVSAYAGYQAFAERWNGTTWALIANPFNSNLSVPAPSISCATTWRCQVVGYTEYTGHLGGAVAAGYVG